MMEISPRYYLSHCAVRKRNGWDTGVKLIVIEPCSFTQDELCKILAEIKATASGVRDILGKAGEWVS